MSSILNDDMVKKLLEESPWERMQRESLEEEKRPTYVDLNDDFPPEWDIKSIISTSK